MNRLNMILCKVKSSMIIRQRLRRSYVTTSNTTHACSVTTTKAHKCANDFILKYHQYQYDPLTTTKFSSARLWSNPHRMFRTTSTSSKSSLSSSSSSISSLPSLVHVDEQVQDAIHYNRPVVALESTIITHGMSYPENLHLLQRIYSILLNKQVTPALIAIKNGVCHIGISNDNDIQDLVRSGQEHRATKCSTRDISILLSNHRHHAATTASVETGPITSSTTTTTSNSQWGATTVASTMKLASMVGISTFVTGGIGGVHRDGHNTFDISTDLIELSRTPVIVVSAGIKSILDIPRTLEVLETYGVPVIAYQTNDFPAFFSPTSGVKAPERMDDVHQIASAYTIAKQLQLKHGFLVAVPNTDPASINIENAIQAALIEAKEGDITGRDVTPFILKYVAERTQGDSLRSNVALVERNTIVGADIAIAVAQFQQISRNSITTLKQSRSSSMKKDAQVGTYSKSRVIVMGGIVLDIIARPVSDDQILTLHTSNPAICMESDGGVGRNIAETLMRLGSNPLLFSVVGSDTRGTSILRRLQEECGFPSIVEATIQMIPNTTTATYVAILNEHRDLHIACADMNVFQHIVPPSRETLQDADFLVLDANPPISTLEYIAKVAVESNVKVFFDPTSVPKAQAICAKDDFISCLTYASPNLDELFVMTGTTDAFLAATARPPTTTYDEAYIQTYVQPIADQVVKRMNPNEAHLIVTCGENGVLLASRFSHCEETTFERFHIVPTSTNRTTIQNATGAGDTLAGAFIHAILQGKSTSDAVRFGMEAASLSLQCTDRAISPLLSSLQLPR